MVHVSKKEKLKELKNTYLIATPIIVFVLYLSTSLLLEPSEFNPGLWPSWAKIMTWIAFGVCELSLLPIVYTDIKTNVR